MKFSGVTFGSCGFSIYTVTMATQVMVPLSVLLSWFTISILVAVLSPVVPMILYFPLPVLPSSVIFTPLCVHVNVSSGPPRATQDNVMLLPLITFKLDSRGTSIFGFSEEIKIIAIGSSFKRMAMVDVESLRCGLHKMNVYILT